MPNFKQINPAELALNPIKAIGTDWMLFAVEHGATANPMTASWGGTGFLWNKPVAFAFLRPSRLTRELVDTEEGFSLNFLDESYREQLALCGSKSGRELDKAEACGFEVLREGGTPYFAQAHTVLVCRKLYRQEMGKQFLIDASIDSFYADGEYHILYVAEIEKVLVRE